MPLSVMTGAAGVGAQHLVDEGRGVARLVGGEVVHVAHQVIRVFACDCEAAIYQAIRKQRSPGVRPFMIVIATCSFFVHLPGKLMPGLT